MGQCSRIERSEGGHALWSRDTVHSSGGKNSGCYLLLTVHLSHSSRQSQSAVDAPLLSNIRKCVVWARPCHSFLIHDSHANTLVCERDTKTVVGPKESVRSRPTESYKSKLRQRHRAGSQYLNDDTAIPRLTCSPIVLTTENTRPWCSHFHSQQSNHLPGPTRFESLDYA